MALPDGSEKLGNLLEVQIAGMCRSMRNNLRLSAFVPGFLGFLLLVPASKDYGAPAVILGVVFLAIALWVVIAAQPAALIVNGTLMTISGVALVGIGIYGLVHHAEGSGGALGFGIVCAIWGPNSISRHKRYKTALAMLKSLGHLTSGSTPGRSEEERT